MRKRGSFGVIGTFDIDLVPARNSVTVLVG